MPIEEGKAAPAFTLQDAAGNKVALKDLRGHNVIVYFYPRDNTPGCTKEACGFRDLWRDIQKQDAVVLGVSPDSAASHQKFATQYQLPFTLLCDPDKKVMAKIRCLGREDDVRQKNGGRHSLDGLDRPQRQGEKTLEAGRQSRRPSGQSARSLAGRIRFLARGLSYPLRGGNYAFLKRGYDRYLP